MAKLLIYRSTLPILRNADGVGTKRGEILWGKVWTRVPCRGKTFLTLEHGGQLYVQRPHRRMSYIEQEIVNHGPVGRPHAPMRAASETEAVIRRKRELRAPHG